MDRVSGVQAAHVAGGLADGGPAETLQDLTRAGLPAAGCRGLLAAEGDFDTLSTWLRATLRHALTCKGLSAAVMNSALDRGNGLVSAWHAELFEVGAALLSRARQSGAVAADADDADVLKMVGAIARAAQDSPDSQAQADRLLALLMNGLRDGGARR